MTADSRTTAPHVFTIGHSNHAWPVFRDLLRRYAVEVVVDTRSQPFSRFSPQFNGRELQEALRGDGFKYLFLGRELGGRPVGSEFYDADGHVLYSRVAESSVFKTGVERLVDGIARFRVALLCSEEDPLDCHRRLLIGRVLTARGVALDHIRGDGSVHDEAAIAARVAAASAQVNLFAQPEERAWRSTRSVSRSTRPPTSSER